MNLNFSIIICNKFKYNIKNNYNIKNSLDNNNLLSKSSILFFNIKFKNKIQLKTLYKLSNNQKRYYMFRTKNSSSKLKTETVIEDSTLQSPNGVKTNYKKLLDENNNNLSLKDNNIKEIKGEKLNLIHSKVFSKEQDKIYDRNKVIDYLNEYDRNKSKSTEYEELNIKYLNENYKSSDDEFSDDEFSDNEVLDNEVFHDITDVTENNNKTFSEQFNELFKDKDKSINIHREIDKILNNSENTDTSDIDIDKIKSSNLTLSEKFDKIFKKEPIDIHKEVDNIINNNNLDNKIIDNSDTNTVSLFLDSLGLNYVNTSILLSSLLVSYSLFMSYHKGYFVYDTFIFIRNTFFVKNIIESLRKVYLNIKWFFTELGWLDKLRFLFNYAIKYEKPKLNKEIMKKKLNRKINFNRKPSKRWNLFR